MPRPTDAVLAAAVGRMFHAPGRAAVSERHLLHAAPGRGVERLLVAGRPVVVKWRDDRPEDREALLYYGLQPAVLRLLCAPRPMGALCLEGTHLLFLEWLEGRDADWTAAADVRRAFTHLGLVHRASAARLRRGPAALAGPSAWREIQPEAAEASGPLVLDPGDLHAANFRLRPEGSVSMLDFENMRLRAPQTALRPLREDESTPRGSLAVLARSAYAAAWPDAPFPTA